MVGGAALGLWIIDAKGDMAQVANTVERRHPRDRHRSAAELICG